MLQTALAPQLLILYVFAASALYIHFRGRVRHTFTRQITDHSTFIAPYNALVYLFSAVPSKAYVNVDAFAELKPLQDNWTIIRDEALKLYDAGHIRAAEKNNDIAFNTFFKRGWKRFYLKWYGDAMPSALELCPRTTALVNAIPNVNAALFALLPPGAKLGEHRDPFAGSLRYHLGLSTPNSDACSITVDGEPYSWRDGEAVMFDETFIHSAVNNSNQTRIILFCDITRPLKTPVMRAVNDFVIRHVVKATAAQNDDTETVGVVNRFSAQVYALKSVFKRAKLANRTAYYAAKYALLGGAFYFLFLSGLNVVGR
jgi:beta-hydroxylase